MARAVPLGSPGWALHHSRVMLRDPSYVGATPALRPLPGRLSRRPEGACLEVMGLLLPNPCADVTVLASTLA
jgi:hypothetical protein